MKGIPYKEVGVAVAWLLAFVLLGGAWVGWVQRQVGSEQTSVLIGLFAVALTLLFLWMLFTHVRAILHDPRVAIPRGALILFDVALYVLTFAWVYSTLGIVDGTGAQQSVSFDFGDCIYYSMVTITTVGYGDFFPTPRVRFVAAVQALGGYLMLGILVSTGLTALSRHVETVDLDEE